MIQYLDGDLLIVETKLERLDKGLNTVNQGVALPFKYASDRHILVAIYLVALQLGQCHQVH